MNQLKRNEVGNQIVRLARVSNWDRYFTIELIWVSLDRMPVGSSYWDAEKWALGACKKPNHDVIWPLRVSHWNHARARPSMENETMVRRSGSKVAWYVKNWLILNIQRTGLVPSKRGTSNFILGKVFGFEVGEGIVEEEEWEGFVFWLA